MNRVPEKAVTENSVSTGTQRKSDPCTQADAMRLGCDRGGAKVVPAIAGRCNEARMRSRRR
ncbi:MULTISPECIES: hypothetical protein [Cyanophyceae]|uniref:hypothetical protein n=1 Tax=Cyanophyceae TaxID=3028117 RepID=UPI0016836B23|nr:hypothetical protein [Trichocoleus sp. FACHB-40]MBD2002755.1 hypothetical protein [Trichocoleus sp. FACHB-40]